ncbi:MAG TPA: hypothetical protein VMU93_06550 [Caulobacteraceae bacterium]|nr:hypothetical protein [Caulobacteraceae bacterium]
MGAILAAAEAASAILAVSMNGLQVVQQINQMVATAQSQGRDLTQGEMDAIIAARHSAQTALLATLAAAQAKLEAARPSAKSGA